MFRGQMVVTPFGRATYVSSRADNLDIVKLRIFGAIEATEEALFFHLKRKDVRPLHSIGDIVPTIFGEGCITDIRAVDGIFEVKFLHWQLPCGKGPLLYLQELAFLRAKNHKECPGETTEDKKFNQQLVIEGDIMKSIAYKEKAGSLFKHGNFLKASNTYQKVLITLEV